MYECSLERMTDKIKTMSQFGDAGHGGITRYSLSPEALQARGEFVRRMEAIGATIKFDDMANLYATLPGSEPDLPGIVMASHCDSVKNGGNYDGILGVMGAMEVLETVADQNISHKHNLTAMIWTNEEGSLYPPAMMSSGVICYDYLPEDIRQIISENDAQSLEANINSHLETMRDDIMKRIDQYTECSYLLQKIQNGIDILEASSSLPSEDLAISIEHIPKISLMYDRSEMEGYDYSEMSLDRWISILRKAEHSKHKIMGPVYVTFYEDNIMNKFLSANSMVEFAVHIEDTSSTDDIRDFGDFDAVTMIHIGNYEDIPTSYIQMMKWIRQNGYTVTGPATEEFILSPLDVNDETRRVTKIIIPVEKESK